MGRKMVRMARITNEKTRITTYKKRKACLYKKANEFSTLCGVKTCLIVYGPSRAGDEKVLEPELWPRDESKVREIISKYRDTASSSCIKTYSVQECLDKKKECLDQTKVKVEKMKYCPWDKKLDKCSLSELYAAFVAVESKIQEAANRSQTFQDASWSTEQLGLFGYNQQCVEQHQLFPMEHNGFAFFPYFNQMTSSTSEMASYTNVTEPEMAAQAMFYGSCSDGQYAPMVQRTTAYMEPQHWGLGNSMFNDMKPFTDYPMTFGQVNNDLENSGNISGAFAGVEGIDGIPGVVTGDVAAISGASAGTGGWFAGGVAGDSIEAVGLVVGAKIGDITGIVIGGETGVFAGENTGVVAIVGGKTGEVAGEKTEDFKGVAMVREETGEVAGGTTGDFSGVAMVREETGEVDGGVTGGFNGVAMVGEVDGERTWDFNGDAVIGEETGALAGAKTGDFKVIKVVGEETGEVAGVKIVDFTGDASVGEETGVFSGALEGEVGTLAAGELWVAGGCKLGI
ncbi:unnamed protein product [Thlaspi arvense]|uniref:MADS-box domain-containing protein n=1 Tax=Thlaspi arvense TaxID=13288 RepID=A0AAU9SMM5_THLAR|nr:unnamed protein product [Thlaspi arvense]